MNRDFSITSEQADKFALAILRSMKSYITEHHEELEALINRGEGVETTNEQQWNTDRVKKERSLLRMEKRKKR